MLYFVKGGAASTRLLLPSIRGRQRHQKRIQDPAGGVCIVMGYIFNGTYSAKGSFVKELNIYLKKESFLFKNYLHLDIFAYLSNFIFLKVFPP